MSIDFAMTCLVRCDTCGDAKTFHAAVIEGVTRNAQGRSLELALLAGWKIEPVNGIDRVFCPRCKLR